MRCRKNFDDLLKPELKDKIGFATSDTGNRVIAAMLASKGAEYRAKVQSATDQPAFGLGPGDSRYGDIG